MDFLLHFQLLLWSFTSFIIRMSWVMLLALASRVLHCEFSRKSVKLRVCHFPRGFFIHFFQEEQEEKCFGSILFKDLSKKNFHEIINFLSREHGICKVDRYWSFRYISSFLFQMNKRARNNVMVDKRCWALDTFDCSILNAFDMHRKKARIDVNRKCLGSKILHNLRSESVGKSIKKNSSGFWAL